jgi:DnaJ-domain-containing protein 1
MGAGNFRFDMQEWFADTLRLVSGILRALCMGAGNFRFDMQEWFVDTLRLASTGHGACCSMFLLGFCLASKAVWDLKVIMPVIRMWWRIKDKRRTTGNEPMKVLKLNYYDILKVPRGATGAAVKKAYHRLARVHHPDKNPGDLEATQRFQAIRDAYETLSDEELRAFYNMKLYMMERHGAV